MWQTEKDKARIRVEECGANICGYEVTKTGANGAKVLIDMKPKGDKWTGRIKDNRSGSVYDFTIALRGEDKLRVQGCMMYVLRRRDLDPDPVNRKRIQGSSPD